MNKMRLEPYLSVMEGNSEYVMQSTVLDLVDLGWVVETEKLTVYVKIILV